MQETRPLLLSIRSVALDGGSAADGMLFFLWLSYAAGMDAVEDRLLVAVFFPLPPGPPAPGGDGSTLPAFLDRSGREVSLAHAQKGFPLAEGFRIRFRFDNAPEMVIGCTKGGCVSNGAERSAYKFPTDGEILLEEVDSLSRDPVYQEVLERAGLIDG